MKKTEESDLMNHKNKVLIGTVFLVVGLILLFSVFISDFTGKATDSKSKCKTGSGMGSINIKSDPGGAEIYLYNTLQIQSTPAIVSAFVGPTDVELRKAGFKDYKTNVCVVKDKTASIKADLKLQTPTITSQRPVNPPSSPVSSPKTNVAPLTIDSFPSGADVSLDSGARQGVTPITFPGISFGEHRVEFSKQGYSSITQRVTISNMTGASLYANLIRVPTTGSLSISSNVEANLYLDGVFYTQPPYQNQRAWNYFYLTNVQPGSHNVRLNRTGYNDYTTNVIIRSGEETRVNVNLLPLPSRINSTQ